MGVHRFCLEHIKANLLTHYRRKGLREACQILGTELQEPKYWMAWENLRELHADAADYLQDIVPQMWTLFEDGGSRWGMSTTNISESYNNVLKGARHLPIRAIVESTLEKCAYIFRRDWALINNCNTALPPHPMKMYMDSMVRATKQTVTSWSDNLGLFVVCTEKGNKQEVKYSQGLCSCGKWQNRRFPCSHAIAVAKAIDHDPLGLVNRVYTMDGWRAQFSSSFAPVLGSHSWPVVSWSLKVDEVRLIRHTGRGSRSVSRQKGPMDYTRLHTPQRTPCSHCGNTRHDRKRCPFSHPPSDRRSWQ
jgi:hypothetical protein